ncbi:MAG: MBOAT family O-acyltransferase [Eubacteriales bacterium]
MLGIYTVTPPKWRPHAISLFSLAFYTLANLGSPASILFLILVAVFTYCATFAAFSVRKRYVMVFVSVVLIGVLAVLRYLGVWADEEAARRYLPIGASFYLLASFSCIADVRRGDAKMPRSFGQVLTYITYFPVMVAGPIIKYKDFEELIKPENIRMSAASVGSGIILFAKGFIKRVAIAAILDEYYDSIVDHLLQFDGQPLGIDVGITLAVLLLLAVYFSFSGYSDMGRGLSAMLGLPLAPDFGSCILATTPGVYARNFLASLSLWMDDYIGRPLEDLLGLQKRKGISEKLVRGTVSMICVFVTLLWFKIGIQVLPAIAVLLVPAFAEGFFDLKDLLEKKKFLRPIWRLATFVFVAIFWLLVKTRDLSSLQIIFGNMTLSVPLQAFTISQTLANLEFPLTLILIFIVQFPMLCGVISRKNQSPFIKHGELRWVWSLLILAIFVFCIYYYLPQYPSLATAPFRDIIF